MSGPYSLFCPKWKAAAPAVAFVAQAAVPAQASLYTCFPAALLRVLRTAEGTDTGSGSLGDIG